MPGVSLIPLQYLNFYDLLVCFFKKRKKDACKCCRKFYESLCFLFLFLYFFTLRRIQIQWGTCCDGRQANHQQGTGDDFRIRSENRRNSARQRKGSFSCATHVVETVILWRHWIFPIRKYDFRCPNNYNVFITVHAFIILLVNLFYDTSKSA